MPTRLPNGVAIWNATPHPLHFLCNGAGVVTVQPDEVINALPYTTEVQATEQYTLNTVEFLPTEEGTATLNMFKTLAPDALVVGSIIAAQAYPGQVVASVPYRPTRMDKHYKNLVRSDRFTIFQKEN